jgi:hypothetical protein
MITLRMIRWFTIWLMVLCGLICALGVACTGDAGIAIGCVGIVGIQLCIVLLWIASHLAHVERELATYLDNNSDSEEAKTLADFLFSGGSIRQRPET